MKKFSFLFALLCASAMSFAAIDWSGVSWLGNGTGNVDFTDKYKAVVSPALPEPGFINNLQMKNDKAALHVAFPSAAFGAISLDESAYASDGAGKFFYLEGFTAQETEFTVVCSDVTYTFTIYNKDGKAAAAAVWTAVNSIAAGDVVVLGQADVKKELSGISSTSTKYGEGAAFESAPAGKMPLTVVAGNSEGTFAFKTSDNKYLYWTSGNSLNVNETLSDNTSWKVSFSGDYATIKNAKDETRVIWWNVSSPRFACYTDKTHGDSYKSPSLYKALAAAAVAKPVIAGETSFFDESEVTITCETEGAKIYYTLDGTDPTAESTEYTAAFKINATKTVKAIAIKGEDKSAIASKDFTLNPTFASIKALVDANLPTGTLVKVSFADLTIDSIYVSSKQKRQGVWVNVMAANEKAVEIYSYAEVPAEWEVGDKISGTIIGEWKLYNGQWEIQPTANDWAWTELTFKAAPALNIFAYGLKASEVADGKVTIDYSLNAKATAVEIQLLDAEGAVKKAFEATGLKKGANQEVLDLAGVAAGTYNWAVKATAKPTAGMENVLDYDKKLYNFYLPQGIAIDNSPESPFFGRIYVSESIDGMSDGATDRTKATKQGIFIYDPLLTDITNQGTVGYKGSLKTACSASGDRVSFKRVVVDKDGYVYVNSLDANVGGVYRLDPANPKADLVPVLDTTKRGTLYAPISSILVEGQGEDKVLYTAENFVASASKGSINKYAIGNATNFAGKADTVILNSSDYALGISDNQFVSDGRGGFWGCQHRWGYDVWSAVYHINANKVRDYVIMKDVNTDVLPQTSDVTTYRGVIAINEAKTLLAIPTKSRVVVYNIAYNAETGVPTLTEAYRTDAIFGTNIDGLAFDLAENLYVMSASKEKMFAFATVKAENNCTTPAKKASKIVVAGTGTAIDNNFAPAKVEKVIVNGQVLIIRDGKTYNMMGQTVK